MGLYQKIKFSTIFHLSKFELKDESQNKIAFYTFRTQNSSYLSNKKLIDV